MRIEFICCGYKFFERRQTIMKFTTIALIAACYGGSVDAFATASRRAAFCVEVRCPQNVINCHQLMGRIGYATC